MDLKRVWVNRIYQSFTEKKNESLILEGSETSTLTKDARKQKEAAENEKKANTTCRLPRRRSGRKHHKNTKIRRDTGTGEGVVDNHPSSRWGKMGKKKEGWPYGKLERKEKGQMDTNFREPQSSEKVCKCTGMGGSGLSVGKRSYTIHQKVGGLSVGGKKRKKMDGKGKKKKIEVSNEGRASEAGGRNHGG